MRILLLGGTGTIGAPLLLELVRSGHEVHALGRSDAAAQHLASCGAQVLRGDLREPAGWIARLPDVDAVVHVAGTFLPDEADVDRRLLDHLLPRLSDGTGRRRLVYTGGCWLYGSFKGSVTTERSPFAPLAAFAWSVNHLRRVLEDPGVEAVVVHPAMVYGAGAGVFARFRDEAEGGAPVRIVGGERVRWPLVHAEDLAILYRLALERARPGASYLGVAVEGLAVGDIARAYLARAGRNGEAPVVISATEAEAAYGHWAGGYALDQVQRGERAQHELGWHPRHFDPLGEIAAGTV
ncbi:MAG: NAD-dependent epimerase/dehydratase family protein [Proteobacteria bacterium]|nr:NAD-dependent epimerase/dehydratase family protein [Pseudomonadota bacterium]